MRRSFVFAAVSLVAVSCPVKASPLDGFKVVGTLACTTREHEQRSVDVKLSCNFESSQKGGHDYEGFIARLGPSDVPGGKRVLIWTVSANMTEKPLELQGTYLGITGGAPPGVLARSPDQSVRLEPVSAASQLGDKPVYTVLELRLEPTKV